MTDDESFNVGVITYIFVLAVNENNVNFLRELIEVDIRLSTIVLKY